MKYWLQALFFFGFAANVLLRGYYAVNGRDRQEPTGFPGVVGVIIGGGIMLLWYYKAGFATELFP